MTALSMDGICLDFDDTWSVRKWDDSVLFTDGIRKLNGELEGRAEGTKAVDAIGVRHDVPYLFEVKDFRGSAIENKKRQLAELALEVGLKARDTIAGLLGLVAIGTQDDLSQRWIRAVHGDRRVHVFALLAEDSARPGELSSKRGMRAAERSKRVEQRLAWLTPRVRVIDPLRDAASLLKVGVTATSEAGAGPGRP